MARTSVTLQLVGSSFTLFELEQFIRDAREKQLPVDGPVSITHQEGDRPGSSTEYILSVTGSAQAAHPKDRP